VQGIQRQPAQSKFKIIWPGNSHLIFPHKQTALMYFPRIIAFSHYFYEKLVI
jgi:hypothetical protein